MTETAVLRLVISLLFIVALILAGAWLSRRAGWLRNGTDQALKIIGTQSLGARAYIALVEVEDARLVVGVTANQISLLHTLPPADPAVKKQSPGAEATAFSTTLSKIIKGR